MLPLTLVPMTGMLAVCKLPNDASIPDWAVRGVFFSITRTDEELSVVCDQDVVPEGVRCDMGWRCLRVGGTLDFSVVGVLASLAGPLAGAAVSVFVLSTFDTDYLLVKEQDFERAVLELVRQGHSIHCDRLTATTRKPMWS